MTDEKEFDSIYAAYSKLVYNLCLQYLLHNEDAADATQEVFVKVYQKMHLYKPEAASFKTWIYQIAINHCLDMLKAKKTKKRFGFITSLFQGDSDEPISQALEINHPGIAAENKERTERLLSIIYALPDNQKTAIILTRIEERPQREVAEIMKLSVKAVESLLQRAKRNISIALTERKGF